MPEATGSINRSNTICHYTRFFRFLESNCNGCNVGDPKMVELLHLFAENGLGQHPGDAVHCTAVSPGTRRRADRFPGTPCAGGGPLAGSNPETPFDSAGE